MSNTTLERPKTVRLEPDYSTPLGGPEFTDYALSGYARSLGVTLTTEQKAAASTILNELYQHAHKRRTFTEPPHASLSRKDTAKASILSMSIADGYSKGLIPGFLKSGRALGPLFNLELRTGRLDYPLNRQRLLMNLMLTPLGRHQDYLQAAMTLGADVKFHTEDMTWEAQFSPSSPQANRMREALEQAKNVRLTVHDMGWETGTPPPTPRNWEIGEIKDGQRHYPGSMWTISWPVETER